LTGMFYHDIGVIKMARQQAFEFRTWGGKRKNAGRKAKLQPGQRVHRRVRRRPKVSEREAIHVVLPVTREVGRLRRRSAYQAVRVAMRGALLRRDFRIVHVSIQSNHLHLLVEASDERALARGVQGFEISCARRLNRAVARDRRETRPRRGRVFVNRYHAEVIDSPRRARHALAYVLNNWRRHREDERGLAQRRALVDPYSSGIDFDGWAGRSAPFARPPEYEALPVVAAETWLLTAGWRRHGLVDVRETPGPR